MQISTLPGRMPRWSRTAEEIFYVTLEQSHHGGPPPHQGQELEPGKPRQWTGNQIEAPAFSPNYDLAPDCKRFAVFPAAEDSGGGEKVNVHMTFLLNFFDYLKGKILPAR